MIAKALKTIALAVMPAAMLALTSCSSTPKGPGKVETFQQEGGGSGFGGQVVVDQVTTTNTVVSIDAALRQVVLRQPDGQLVTYKAGPEIFNLSEFKPGDPVKATVIQELAVSVVGTGALPKAGEGPVVVRSPNGLVLRAMPVNILKFTAKVMALDYLRTQATLQMPDGQIKTVRVRQAINLGDFNVGDNVSVRMTEALAIKLEGP